jgi:ABC-2 type transport system permease protein
MASTGTPDLTRDAGRWLTVTGQELRDLWIGGRGPVLIFAFSVLISVITYLGASNQSLNFLEQHETVNLTLQVAVAVGALLAMVVAADAISGERERGTLEILLLTPVPRGQLVAGKLLGAISLWLVALLVTVPYVWFLGHGIGIVGKALAVGFAAGTVLAVGLTAFGILISAFARTNRTSLSASLLVLLALFAPTQLPTGTQNSWVGEFLSRVNPVSAAEHYIGNIVIDRHPWTQDLSWLASPIVAAIALTIVATLVVPRYLTLAGSLSR